MTTTELVAAVMAKVIVVKGLCSTHSKQTYPPTYWSGASDAATEQSMGFYMIDHVAVAMTVHLRRVLFATMPMMLHPLKGWVIRRLYGLFARIPRLGPEVLGRNPDGRRSHQANLDLAGQRTRI